MYSYIYFDNLFQYIYKNLDSSKVRNQVSIHLLEAQ